MIKITRNLVKTMDSHYKLKPGKPTAGKSSKHAHRLQNNKINNCQKTKVMDFKSEARQINAALHFSEHAKTSH